MPSSSKPSWGSIWAVIQPQNARFYAFHNLALANFPESTAVLNRIKKSTLPAVRKCMLKNKLNSSPSPIKTCVTTEQTKKPPHANDVIKKHDSGAVPPQLPCKLERSLRRTVFGTIWDDSAGAEEHANYGAHIKWESSARLEFAVMRTEIENWGLYTEIANCGLHFRFGFTSDSHFANWLESHALI